MEIIEATPSTDGSAKFALRCGDGRLIEALYFRMDRPDGTPYDIYHVCISSQAGCAMGCTFCATGFGGFFRNLSEDEIMAQMRLIRSFLIESRREEPDQPFNIVMMGMGEPLANVEALERFIDIASDEFGENLNKIAISTVGLADKVYRLAENRHRRKLKLFLSLHSPFDGERETIIPVNKRFKLSEVLDSARFFANASGSKVKATYLLLGGLNDTPEHAEAFAELLDPAVFEAQIQLYNATPGLPYSRVDDETAYAFRDALAAKGIETIVQISKGRDIDGGCGQLVKAINERAKVRTSRAMRSTAKPEHSVEA